MIFDRKLFSIPLRIDHNLGYNTGSFIPIFSFNSLSSYKLYTKIRRTCTCNSFMKERKRKKTPFVGIILFGIQ